MNFVNIMSAIKTDVKLSSASPIESVKNTKVPMLFIHGDADKLVSLTMMEDLFENSNSTVKDKMIVHGAGHGDSMVTDTEKYFNKIFAFLNDLK